jgi:hypothetical protein
MKRKRNIKILLSSKKAFTNSENCSESPIKIYVLASFPAIGRFSPVFFPYRNQEKSAKCTFHQRLSEQTGSQAAFGTIVSAVCGYQKAGTSSLN